MARNLVTEGRIDEACRLLGRIDEACRLLRDVADIERLSRIVLHAYVDGRVDVECIDERGFHVRKTLHADVTSGGALPAPGEAIGRRTV